MNELQSLPPELLVDPTNPANDRYYEQLARLRGVVNHAASRLRPRKAEVVRLHHQGVPTKEIAQRTGYTTTTVNKTLANPAAQNLLAALRHAQALVDGPNLELRRNMLWRIAQRSEDTEPTTTIHALKELNKLAGSYPVQAPNVATVTNIIINGEQLPRTKLDE